MAWLVLQMAVLVGGRTALAREQAGRTVLLEALSPAGQVVTDEIAGRIEALVAGQRVPVGELEVVGEEWRVVLLFDQLLTNPLDFGNAALQLAERSRELTHLGTVEILVAGREMRTALPATRDPDVLEQALHWIRLREESEDLQEELRWRLLENLGFVGEGSGVVTKSEGTRDAAEVVALAQAAIEDEMELLRDYHEQLLLWASETTATSAPKAIVLVSSGYDAQPDDFYRSLLVKEFGEPTAARLTPVPIQPSVFEVSQVFAAYGWVAVPYLPEQRANELLEPGEGDAAEQEGKDKVDVILQDGRLVDKTTIGVDPLKWLRERRERSQKQEEAPVLILNPGMPIQELAEATGGELVRGKFQLSDLLERLPRRQELAIDLGDLEVGAQPLLELELEIEGEGPRSTLRYPRWLSQVTPEVVSGTRARRILDNQLDEGELPLIAALQSSENGRETRLVIKRDLFEEGGQTGSPLRVTVAISHDEAPTELLQEELQGWDRVEAGETPEDLVLELGLDRQPEGPVVVVVEELETGLWGATFASFVEPGTTASVSDSLESLVLPAPRVIHLMAPRQGFAMGRTLMETVVSVDQVASVEFRLDGESQVVRDSPPFSAVLDLGPLPQPRRVEVVARNAAGAELGSDYLIVNEGSGVFGVRIVEPRPRGEGDEPQRFAGPIDVHAEVEPRRGEGVDRVEFYWMDELVATRYAPPYRQRVVVPPEAPRGFIRVVAYLEDGNSSEDVVFLNSPGSSEKLQVNLMELYVVVTDRKGRPVKGLSRERFRILEDGVMQDVATFSDAGELPLTVGLAIDSSASMFVKLPDVQCAAAEFLRSLATRRDRAFVVGFGTEPRLTRNTTSDLPEVIRSLDRLQPDGQTGIWKAIVYSLVQLQGVPGKKALVVYTDGADEDPDFAYRTALRFARKVGVPIYVILSNNEIMRTEGKGLSVRGFLERLEALTSSVGGRVFFARVGQNLAEVYAEIDEELRSQYLVGYYSEYSGGEEWRQIEIVVEGGGLSARTIAGYYR
jgi:Ca-activated chloride channel family protein